MDVMTDHHDGRNRNEHRRRGVVRTALILGAVVVAIYLAFIGRGVLNYLT